MKRRNKKWITLMLAGLCTASLGVATVGVINTATAAETYATSAIFGTTGGGTIMEYAAGTVTTTSFELANDKSVNYKRDLAFHWYEGKDTPKYLTVKFSFKELNFTSVAVDIESKASIATEDEKILNTVKFKVESGVLKVAVINDELLDEDGNEKAEVSYVDVTADPNTSSVNDITLELAKGSAFDSFKVKVNGVEMAAEFTNIGANYADYDSEGVQPLTFTAKTEGENKAVVALKEINGQTFAIDSSNKITDNAAPVLVVNQEINYLQYGVKYALDYAKVDVLQDKSLGETLQYYQYNPNDETKEISYKTKSGDWYLMDSVYTEDGTGKKTSQYAQFGEEYFSIQYKLKDSNGNVLKNGDEEIAYDLAWYAQSVASKTVNNASKDFIVVKEDSVAPNYVYVTTDDTNKENVYTNETTATNKAADYQEKVNKKTENAKAGSSQSVTLPAVEWMLEDDGGYRGMRFTISYKKPSSTSPTAISNRAYSNLSITTTEAGEYEFKIFATDATGNTMQYYVDGKLVDLSSSNVWEIDQIPKFSFNVAATDLAVEDSKTDTAENKKAEKRLDETYTLSGLTVVGTADDDSAYKLYKLNRSNYSGPAITEEALTSVTYKEICSEIEARRDAIKIGDGSDCDYKSYFDWYLDIYAEKIAAEIDGSKDAIRACFVEIEEYNSRITEEDAEWEAYNKYKWNPTDKSFTTAEEGEYLIVADFWEQELPLNRAAGYKVIIVDSKADVIEGDSKFAEWIKNNMVSVILFGVAGLMLIAILILLLVKPSDETLEDVEAKAERKAAKKKKAAEEAQE